MQSGSHQMKKWLGMALLLGCIVGCAVSRQASSQRVLLGTCDYAAQAPAACNPDHSCPPGVPCCTYCTYDEFGNYLGTCIRFCPSGNPGPCFTKRELDSLGYHWLSCLQE